MDSDEDEKLDFDKKTAYPRTQSLSALQIIKKVGAGAFGTVFKAVRLRDKKVFALKKIPVLELNAYQQQKLLKESLENRHIRHPNIVRHVTSFLENGALCLLMEFVPGGELGRVILPCDVIVHPGQKSRERTRVRARAVEVCVRSGACARLPAFPRHNPPRY